MIRIITGKYKGQRLSVPPRLTRPLTDRIRTVVFDLIHDFVRNGEVLDMYAGSGIFGFEALSRGATSVDFVDGSRQSVRTIEKNTDKLGVQDQISIYPWKVGEFLRKNAKTYDIIFVDPPFPDPTTGKLEIAEQSAELLKKEGILILRLDSKEKPDPAFSNLTIAYKKKIGRSTVYFLRKTD